jgi:hypothetical protein
MSLRDTILGARTVPTEEVPIPALGIIVIVRGMTGKERDAFEASCFEGRGKKREFKMANLRAKLVAYCCVEADGHRVFSDEDAEALGAVRADVIDRLFGVAQRLSGMSDQDVDELGRSSEKTGVSSTSSSASPASSG